MPSLPVPACRSPCYPRCAARATGAQGYCPEHATRARRERRFRNHEALSDARWWRESRAYLREPAHEYCEACAHEGRRTPANVVAHRVAHKGNVALFWARSNWAPSCRSCNSRQAATSEGRWG